MKKVLVIGAIILDISMELEVLPQSGDDIYALSESVGLGGCAYNVSDILHKLGVEHTLFAPIGNGRNANTIKECLKQKDIEIPCLDQNIDNGYSLCLVEKNGERTFINKAGIECAFQKEWFLSIDASEYESVYVCGYEIEGSGGEHIVSFLEENPHLKVYYAPGPRIHHIEEDLQARVFGRTSILHLNDKELLEFTKLENIKEALTALYEKVKAPIVVTLGKDGACYYDGTYHKIPGYEVLALDTTGAGDSHIGTVIAMQVRGHILERSIQVANKVASWLVGIKGATLDKLKREDWYE